MPGMAAKIRLTEKQLAVIEELARSRSISVSIGQRATIVLLGFRGMLNEDIAEVVGLNRHEDMGKKETRHPEVDGDTTEI